METYNEKQIALASEICHKREEAAKNFHEQENAIKTEIEKAGIRYDEQKKQLQSELDDVLKERLLMKKGGMTIIAEQYAQNLAREREIHKQQYESRMAFFEERRTFNRQLNILTENYRDEKSKIEDYKHERLLQIERERKLLSLQNEETKD